MSNQDQRSLKKLTEKTYNNLSYDVPKNFTTKESNKDNGYLQTQSIPKIYNRFHKLVKSVNKSRTTSDENSSRGFQVSHMYVSSSDPKLFKGLCSFEIDRSINIENFNACIMSSFKTNSSKTAKLSTELPNHRFFLLRKSLLNCSIRTPNETPAHIKTKVKNAYDILSFKQNG